MCIVNEKLHGWIVARQLGVTDWDTYIDAKARQILSRTFTTKERMYHHTYDEKNIHNPQIKQNS